MAAQLVAAYELVKDSVGLYEFNTYSILIIAIALPKSMSILK